MNLGNDSISFGSFASGGYLTVNNSNRFTFHQGDHNSEFDLSKSLIHRFPGEDRFMGNKIQIVCLLQAAEIQRLSANLEQYRMQFKQMGKLPLDRHSYEMQIKQLTETASKETIEKNRLKDLLIKTNQKISTEMTDLQLLQQKYHKSLLYIDKLLEENQKNTNQNNRLSKQLGLQKMKFEAFQRQQIKQIQNLREQFDERKDSELSFQLGRLKSQKQMLSNLIELQKQNTTIVKNETSNLKKEIEQMNNLLRTERLKFEELQQNSNNKIALACTELQRLNSLIKQKNNNLEDKEKQLQKLKQSINFYQNKLNKSQRQLSNLSVILNQRNHELTEKNNELAKASTYISQLSNNILNLEKSIITEKQIQKQMLEQLNSHKEILSKSSYQYEQEVQNYRQKSQNYHRQINLKNIQIQKYKFAIDNLRTNLDKIQRAYQLQIQSFQTLKSQREREISLVTQQNEKLNDDIEMLRRKLQNLKKQMDEKNNQNTKLASQLSALNEHSKVISINALKSQEKVKEITSYNIQIRQQISLLSLKIDKMQNERGAKSIGFDEMLSEISKLSQQVNSQTYLNEQLMKRIESLSQNQSQMKNEILGLKKLINEITNLLNQQSENQKQKWAEILQLMADLKVENKLNLESLTKYWENLNQKIISKIQLSQQLNQKKKQSSELIALKQKLQLMQAQRQKATSNSQEYKKIIQRVILITKENSQLKNQSLKKTIELQNTIKYHNDLRSELVKANQNLKSQLLAEKYKYTQLLQQKQRISVQYDQQRKLQVSMQSTIMKLQDICDKQLKEYEETKRINQNLKAQNEKLQDLLEQERNRFKKQLAQLNLSHIDQIDGYNQQLRNEQNKINELQDQRRSQQKNWSQKIQISKQNEQQKQLQLLKLKDQNIKLMNELRHLQQQLLKAASQILAQEKQIYQKSQFQILLSNQANLLSKSQQKLQIIVQKYQRLYIECQAMRQKSKNQQNDVENAKNLLMSYNQKIQSLTSQLQRQWSLINKFRQENKHLEQLNYDCNLSLEKSKYAEQKIKVLNSQIERLNEQKIMLKQEVSLCRLQLYGQSTLERQNNQNLSLFVLLFAQVESLRQRIQSKQKQLDLLRKSRFEI